MPTAQDFFALAVQYERTGAVQQAVYCYREVLRLRPDFAEVQANLAGLLADQGQLDEAADLMRQAARRCPTIADMHYNLGVILRKQDRHEEAVECYRQA